MELGWAQGWSGFMLTYASAQGPMLVGLVRSRASAYDYCTSPIVAATLSAVTGLGMAAATPFLSGLGAAPHGLIQFAIGTLVSATLGYAAGRGASDGPKRPLHQRGSVVEEASRRGEAPGRERARQRTQELTLAGIPVPSHDETKHFKLVGTTGTGKSTAIREILGAALARGDRAVIADPDGGYLKQFYDAKRGDVLLNPFDQRSVKWDLFGEIRNAYDVDQLARSLIPDHEGSDRSWRGYARTFFTAVTRQANDGGVKDLDELYRLLVAADTKELRVLLEGTAAQPFLNEHNSKMFDSIRSVTSSAVEAVEYVAKQAAPQFSIRDWIGGESTGVLFIPYKAGQIAALRSTISAWMRIAIFETMNLDEQPDERASEDPRRLWFVVDELDALGQIDGLKDALARLRKFGGRCVLGFQSVAQVSSTYGQGDAHTIVENCGNSLILRCSSSEGGGTARFASQLIGDREVMRTTFSRSRRDTEFFGSVSTSEMVKVEAAVLPSQIEQLPDLAGYLKLASDPRWRRVRLDAAPEPERRRDESRLRDESRVRGSRRPAEREREGTSRD